VNKREIGNKGEAIAASFLENKGIKGKILTGDYLTFTEPKALKKLLSYKNIDLKVATNRKHHTKAYFVGYLKQQKIRKLARYYLNEKHYFTHSIRFDCIGIMGEKIDWIKGAFY